MLRIAAQAAGRDRSSMASRAMLNGHAQMRRAAAPVTTALRIANEGGLPSTPKWVSP
jgi:hypothetical protein